MFIVNASTTRCASPLRKVRRSSPAWAGANVTSDSWLVGCFSPVENEDTQHFEIPSKGSQTFQKLVFQAFNASFAVTFFLFFFSILSSGTLTTFYQQNLTFNETCVHNKLNANPTMDTTDFLHFFTYLHTF